jgi:hypothetical protein
MNSNTRLLSILAACLASSVSVLAAPLTTAFTYQGRLDYNGAPATGVFDLKFELYTEQTGGTLAVPALQASRQVSGGLISEDLNFGGAAVFDGRALWMEISARPQGAATFFVMPGRTAVRPTPYAIHALQAGSVKDGGVTNSSLAAGAVTSAKLATGAVGLAQLNAGAPSQINSVLAYNGSGLSWQLPQNIGQWGPTVANDGIFYMGKVGIGTNTPATRLTVFATGYGIEQTDGTVTLGHYTAASHDAAFIGTRSNHKLHLEVNGSPRMTVATSGNVGIGTSSPASKLTVDTPGYGLEHTSGAVRMGTYVGGTTHTAGWLGTISNHPLSFFTNNSDTRLTIATNGNVGIGTSNPTAKLYVEGNVSMTSCTIRGGADLAEPFAMSHGGVEPGAVVVIDSEHPGKLKRSTHAYDKKVAGIVSGANGIKPGISMIQEDMLEAGENVALSGRVFVKAETSAGAIEPGDLLTTSSKPGCAMKAADHSQAQGAILGKAMTGLTDGEGMVLVLVTLQ